MLSVEQILQHSFTRSNKEVRFHNDLQEKMYQVTLTIILIKITLIIQLYCKMFGV